MSVPKEKRKRFTLKEVKERYFPNRPLDTLRHRNGMLQEGAQILDVKKKEPAKPKGE